MNMSKMGSKHVQNAVKKFYDDAVLEFEDGIIGPKVWSFLFAAAGISTGPGWILKNVPTTDLLKKIPKKEGEIVITTVKSVNNVSVNGLFWGKLEVPFQNNLPMNGISWRRYLQTGFAHERGVFIGNPSGIALGLNHDEQKTCLGENDFIPFLGLQIIPEAVHFLLRGEFLNKNHAVKCHSIIGKHVMVGGGDSSLKIYSEGIHPSRIALGKMRKVFIEYL